MLSLDGSRAVEDRLDEVQPATSLSALDHYIGHPITPQFNEMTLLHYIQQFTMRLSLLKRHLVLRTSLQNSFWEFKYADLSSPFSLFLSQALRECLTFLAKTFKFSSHHGLLWSESFLGLEIVISSWSSNVPQKDS